MKFLGKALSLGMSFVLVVTLALVSESAAAPITSSARDDARFGPAVAADLESALLTAHLQRRPIRVADGGPAAPQAWAQPDGTLTLVRGKTGAAPRGPAGWTRIAISRARVRYAPPLAAPRVDVGPAAPGAPRRASSRKPVFSAVATAPAGDNLRVEFELYRGDQRVKRVGKRVAPGVTVTVTPSDFGLSALRARTTYSFRARLRGAHTDSPWSSRVQVVADPATATPAAAVAPAAPAYLTAAAAATVAVTSPEDGDTTARRVRLTATGTTGYTGARFQYRRGAADTWKDIPAGHVVTAATGAAVSWPVTVTNGVSTPLVWTATSTLATDGTVSVQAVYSGTAGTLSSSPVDVVVDRNASTATDTAVGPGVVNLLTGDYTMTATDVSLFGATVSRTASSRRPALGASQDGQVPIFGPQWTSGVIIPETQSLYTGIRPTSTTSVQVMRVDGGWVDFTATAGGGWAPQPGADDLALTGSLTGSFILTDNEGGSTTFVKTSSTGTAWQVSTTYSPTENSTTKVVSEAVTSGSTTLARPTMIISPTAAVAAATCQTAPQTRGCRVLQFVYATATTATSGTPGDYAGRVKQILQWATSPGATAATSVAVAAYTYDTAGRLAQSWDPRISPALKTAYAYDSAGRIVGLTPPGELPWTFTYGTAGGTAIAGDGMLLTASRPTLVAGSASTTDGGTATTWMVYGVPLSGSAAPHAMSGVDVAAWGQTDAPVDATAVFASGELPASHTGSDTTMYPTDYWYATVTYLDAVGREVNTATPGGHLSAVNYDQFGNVVWQLSGNNRKLALSTSGDEARLATLGLSTSTPAQRAALLATTSVYSADGARQLEQYGPLHMVSLAGDLYTEGKPYLSPGAWVPARQHTVYTYDGGRPTDGSAKVSGLVTRTATGAAVPGYTTDGDIRIEAATYDWTAGRPTAKVTDPDGLAITTTMAYDSQGRVVKTTLPKANGSDAGTTTTRYWSATGSGTCAGRPEWAGLVCQVAPGGAITGGGSNPTSVPTRTTEYGRDGLATKVTEVSGSVTRTTTSGHDAAGRLISSAVTGGIGAAVPSHNVTYASNGRPASVSVTGGATTTYTYDVLGRMIGYNDGAGGVTALAHDALDRVVKVSNNIPSTTTYTYDPHEEPRGMPVSVTDSVAGTFTGTYDADGELNRQTMPGGVTLAEYRDEAGNPIERQYHSSSGAVLAYDWVDRTVHNQWASRTLTSSTSADQEYRYDAAGRLTGADDTRSTVCTARTYAYDADTNRTASATATAAAGAGCPSGGTVTAHTYDSAGRLVDAGYAYDAFARTTAAPGTTHEYFANDLVQRQTVGAARQTWTLDALGRIGTSTTEARNASGVWQATGTTVNHYVGNGDSPGWITDSASGNVSRLVAGPEGQTAATTGATSGTALLLTDLHNDVIVQYAVGTAAASVYGFDEFGNPRAGQTATRYGWLGGFERSAATPSGVILMGVRLYAPSLGRFLQVDPVPATDANAYDYAGQDPLAKQDLGGLRKKVWKKRWGIKYGLDVYYNRRETKDLRDLTDAWAQIIENFFRSAPWWWVRDIIEGVYTYAVRLAVMATIAARLKRCVYFVIRAWGQFSTYIYGPGGYCK
ncbi:RHS repeat-associated core domain-containing protein [Actinomycetes bacterium KLBMP 9797]